MPLLTDAQLQHFLTTNPNVIEGLDHTDWINHSSPIQASSVDLHVGDLYLPGESKANAPGTLKSRNELTLETGQTAVVVTKEKLNMPRNWAAYGFPPSHVSSAGLLMTNPGHIDPGFSGKLRFTIINMSAEKIALREGDPIVTLIVHLLEEDVAHDFGQRSTTAGVGPLPDPSWDDVNRLAKDFVDVEARSKKIASEQVRTAQETLNRLDSRTKFTTAVIAAIAGVLGIVGTLLVGWLTGMQSVRTDVNDLKSKISVVEIQKNIADLAARTAAIEKRIDESKK